MLLLHFDFLFMFGANLAMKRYDDKAWKHTMKDTSDRAKIHPSSQQHQWICHNPAKMGQKSRWTATQMKIRNHFKKDKQNLSRQLYTAQFVRLGKSFLYPYKAFCFWYDKEGEVRRSLLGPHDSLLWTSLWRVFSSIYQDEEHYQQQQRGQQQAITFKNTINLESRIDISSARYI